MIIPLHHSFYTFFYSVMLVLFAAPINSIFLAVLGIFGIIFYLIKSGFAKNRLHFLQFSILAIFGLLFYGGGFIWDSYREQVLQLTNENIPEFMIQFYNYDLFSSIIDFVFSFRLFS
eukprot:c25901_g1_i1.p1 GENE.c25901_g1_i1~~c25901_g1_i1.p1  ORF type:complete len:128 (+),score=42.29 c25901_g1_i1:35-385(+)